MTARRWGILGALAAVLLAGVWFWKRAARPPAAEAEAGAVTPAAGRRLTSRELRRWAADPSAAAGRVAGTVHDPDGQPVAGALVVAAASTGRGRGNTDPWTLETAASAMSGPDGSYRLIGLRPGNYDLTATAAGLAAGFRDDIGVAPGEVRAGIDLRLGREGATLSGRLLDSGGGPIARGRLLIRPVNGQRVYLAASDAQGRFRVTLPRGWYRLMGQAGGYAPTSEWISIQGDETRELRLHAAARIAGMVVTEAGAPVADAAVRLVGAERTSRDQRQAETDAAGQFVFSDLQPGSYELLARKGPLVGRHGRPVTVALAESSSEARIVLQTGRTVSGWIRSRSGRPIERALITATPQQLYGQARDRLAAQSGAGGRFVLEGLFPGRFQLLAEAAGRAARRSEVAVGTTDVTGVELTLDDEGVVLGTVVDGGGEPVADASVSAWLQTGAYRNDQFELVHTAGDGTFRIEGLPAGQLGLQVQHSAGIATAGPDPLGAGETRRVTLRLASGVTVTGRVVYPDGRPAPGADVRAQVMSAGGTVLPGATSDASGGYVLANLVPGDLQVIAGPPGQEQYGAGARPSFARLKLAPGERRDGIELTIRKNDLTIGGTVADDKGRPVEGAVVSAGPEYFRGYSGGQTSHRNILTGADGRFLISEVTDQEYTVTVAHPHYPTSSQKSVRGGERAVRLVLKAPATLAGRVVDASGAPVPAYDLLVLPAPRPGESIEEKEERLWGVGSRRQSVGDRSGAFSVRGLPPGRYDLSVTTVDRRAGTAGGIDLAEGGRRDDVKIVVKTAATLKGRVIEYGTGKPIPSAQVIAQGTGLDLQTTADREGRFELVGAPTGGVLSLFVHSYWESHVLDRQEITVPAEGGAIAMADVKLHPGKLDWASPDAGFCGLSPVTRDGRPTVGSLRPGHPAMAAGIRVGDLILAVDGRSVVDACGSTVDFLMRGKAGETIAITVQSPGQAAREVSFQRASR